MYALIFSSNVASPFLQKSLFIVHGWCTTGPAGYILEQQLKICKRCSTDVFFHVGHPSNNDPCWLHFVKQFPPQPLSKSPNPNQYVCTLLCLLSSSELCSLEITCGPHTGCTGVQPPQLHSAHFVWLWESWGEWVSVAAAVTEGAREMSRTEPGSQAQSCESKDSQTGYMKVKELTTMMKLLSPTHPANIE